MEPRCRCRGVPSAVPPVSYSDSAPSPNGRGRPPPSSMPSKEMHRPSSNRNTASQATAKRRVGPLEQSSRAAASLSRAKMPATCRRGSDCSLKHGRARPHASTSLDGRCRAHHRFVPPLVGLYQRRAHDRYRHRGRLRGGYATTSLALQRRLLHLQRVSDPGGEHLIRSPALQVGGPPSHRMLGSPAALVIQFRKVSTRLWRSGV